MWKERKLFKTEAVVLINDDNGASYNCKFVFLKVLALGAPNKRNQAPRQTSRALLLHASSIFGKVSQYWLSERYTYAEKSNGPFYSTEKNLLLMFKKISSIVFSKQFL